MDNLQHPYPAGVRTAGESLLTVIDDILGLSNLEAGKVVLDPSDFNLPQMIEELGALLAPAASVTSAYQVQHARLKMIIQAQRVSRIVHLGVCR